MKKRILYSTFLIIGVFGVKVLLDSFEGPLRDVLTVGDCLLLVGVSFILYTKKEKQSS